MDDREAHFMIAVGDLCSAAGLAGLAVEIRAGGGDGNAVRGVPQLLPGVDGGPQVDDTGYARTLVIDDHVVDLIQVKACTIFAPEAAPPG